MYEGQGKTSITGSEQVLVNDLEEAEVKARGLKAVEIVVTACRAHSEHSLVAVPASS